MLPTKFQFIWPSGFKGGEFKKYDQSEKRIACGSPCLLADQDEMCNLYRGPSIATSYKDSAHLAKRFQRKIFFLEIDQSEARIACGGHVCKCPGIK
jgi:hypothetical protein